MAIEIVYRVKDRNGKVVGEYMDSKLANIIDKRTDVMYEMADKLIATGLSEEQADTAAEMILNSRHDFMDLLKKDEEVTAALSHEQIESVFDLEYHTKHVDTLFKRVFGE